MTEKHQINIVVDEPNVQIVFKLIIITKMTLIYVMMPKTETIN